MGSRRLKIYGFISAAAVVSGALTGCAGSSTSVQGLGGIIHTTGGLPNNTGSAPAGSSSGSTPSQVQVTSTTYSGPATLPAQETVPADGGVTVLLPNVPIIAGASVGPKFHGKGNEPTTANNPGEIFIDGSDTGIAVNSDTSLPSAIILVPGVHNIHVNGTVTIPGSNNGTLTVSAFDFKISTVDLGGTPAVCVSSIPKFVLAIPTNGSPLDGNGFKVSTTFDPYFNGGSAGLGLVAAGGAWSVAQKQPIKNGGATFKANTNQSIIPNPGGLSDVAFSYTP